MKTADIISALIGILLCVYVWITSAGFPTDAIMKIGPDFFPRIIAVGLILACLALIGQAMTRKIHAEAETISPSNPGVRRAITVLVIALLYVTFMDFLGFGIATVALMLAIMYLLKMRNPIQMALVSVGTALVVGFAFNGLLGIQLPLGLLDGLF